MVLFKKEVDEAIKKIEGRIKKVRENAGRKLAREIQLFIERETGKRIAIEAYITFGWKGQDQIEIVPNPGITRASPPLPAPMMSGPGITRALAEKIKREYQKSGWEAECRNIKLHGGQPDQWALFFTLGAKVSLPGGFLLRIF